MKKPFLTYANHAANLNTPVSERGRILATAVALAIACRIPVVAEELASPSEYYSNHVAPTALRVVSEFNEATLLDLRYAEQIGRQFWLQRYDTLHGCPRLVGQADFFQELFGVQTYFSDSEIEFFNFYRGQISLLYTIVCPVVEELLAGKE